MAYRLAMLATLAGCLGEPPKEPYYGGTLEPKAAPVERAVVGMAIDMGTRAYTGCRTESHVVGVRVTSEHDGPSGIGLERTSEVVGCRDQGVEVKAFCVPAASCDTEPETRGTGGASSRIRFIRPGKVTVTLEVNNLETGKHHTNARWFDVGVPETFRLQCMTPALAWGSCADGVAASKPLIRILPILDGKPMPSPLVRVNGKAGVSSTSFTIGQSLEPILGPISPGSYDLDISLGDTHQQTTITIQ